MAKFTLKDYLKDRDVKYPKDFAPYKDNADRTVLILNKFLANYPGQLVISSGFRPAALNNSVKVRLLNQITLHVKLVTFKI